MGNLSPSGKSHRGVLHRTNIAAGQLGQGGATLTIRGASAGSDNGHMGVLLDQLANSFLVIYTGVLWEVRCLLLAWYHLLVGL